MESSEGFPKHVGGVTKMDGNNFKKREASDEQIKNEWIKAFAYKKKCKFNPETKRWDCKGSIVIEWNELIDGHFPIPFGEVKGNFNCTGCASLKTLDGAPNNVGKDFICTDCGRLTSLEAKPHIGGSLKM